MAGLVQPIKDLLAKLETLTEIQFVRVWNNQLHRMMNEDNYSFLLPAAFLEVVTPDYLPIGGAFSESDITFRIRLIVEEYDAGDGTMDQNLSVFILRDKVDALLTLFQPTACSSMFLVQEEQDFDHSNVYHYIMDFRCSFIDSKGSPYDPDAGKFIDGTPPFALEIDQTIVPAVDVPGAPFNIANNSFKIPQ